MARRVQALAIDGQPLPVQLLEVLAASVLDTDVVRLAVEVRERAPHAARRAIELAALVLEADSRSDQLRESGPRG